MTDVKARTEAICNADVTAREKVFDLRVLRQIVEAEVEEEYEGHAPSEEYAAGLSLLSGVLDMLKVRNV